MSNQINDKNCILYSNLAPINKSILLPIVLANKLTIIDIIEEDSHKYKRANKQPELKRVFNLLETGKAKFLLVESLNHLFTVNGVEVIRSLKMLNDLNVTILTPTGTIKYPTCTEAVLSYVETWTSMLRTIAAAAGNARGNALGRRRVECDIKRLVDAVKRHGTVLQAARELDLCHVTAMRRLRDAGYDLDELRQGTVKMLTKEEMVAKLAAARVAREASIAKHKKIKEKEIQWGY